MKYYITIPFNVLTYRKILDNYWSGKKVHNGSLGFYKKSEKVKKHKTFHKYFFSGRVPIGCIDYSPPFINPPQFNNFFTDWKPLFIDDMMVTFRTGEAERLCSQYIFIVDELEDNEIITWEYKGQKWIGAFDATTGGVSVAIQWTIGDSERKKNKKMAELDYSVEKMIRAVQPTLITDMFPIVVDPIWNDKLPPQPLDWFLTSPENGIRGIDFAVTIEKKVLGDLVKKRMASLRISLTRALRLGNMEKATELGMKLNRYKQVCERCDDYYYRI